LPIWRYFPSKRNGNPKNNRQAPHGEDPSLIKPFFSPVPPILPVIPIPLRKW
jgi:hypothetical protein